MISNENVSELRINTRIDGEPAKILRKLKEKGKSRDYTDRICQAIFALNDVVMARETRQKELELEEQLAHFDQHP